MSKLGVVLGLLALALIALGFVAYIAYFYKATVNGRYEIKITVENAVVEGLRIELPRGEGGEPVYRVTEFTATMMHAGESTEITPTFSRMNFGYPEVIEMPVTFRNGVYIIKGEFSMEWVKEYNYSMYPWRLEAGGTQLYTYPTIEEDILFKVFAWIKEYRSPLTVGLGITAIGLALLSIPIYASGPGMKGGQPIPSSATKTKRCRKWCTICVRFFRISTKKGDGTKLPKGDIERIYRLLSGVNSIWSSCCIRFQPCIVPGKGVAAWYLDPRKEVEVASESSTATYNGLEIGFRFVRRVNVAKLFSDRECTILRTSEGQAKTEYTESIEAWWVKGGKYRGKEYKKGQKLPREVLRDFIKDIIKTLPPGSPDRENAKKALSVVEPKAVRGGIEISSVLEQLIRVSDYPTKCIDVVIIDDYTDGGSNSRVRGYAANPGRVTVISSDVLEQDMSEILAHEFGHNLSLKHVSTPGNLMEAVVNNVSLDIGQCEQASKHCGKHKEMAPDPKTCDNGGKALDIYEKRKMVWKEIGKAHNEIGRLKAEVDRINEKVKECKKARRRLWNEYQKAKFVYRKLKKFGRKVERLQQRGMYEQLMRMREEAVKKIRKWRRKDPDNKWTKTYEEALKMIDEDPKNVLDRLEKEMNEWKRKYEECKDFIRRSGPMVRKMKKEINKREKELKRLMKEAKKLEAALPW